MSSHHIVCDAQEPALIIAGSCSFEQVAPFLESSPVLIVLEPYLVQVLEWGIKIDVICLRLEKAQEIEAKTAHQMPLTFLFDKPNVLQAALEYLLQNGHKRVNVLGEMPAQIPEIASQLEVVFFVKI